jgi:hypothetical protein
MENCGASKPKIEMRFWELTPQELHVSGVAIKKWKIFSTFCSLLER